MFTRGFERLKNQEAKAACMLPNVARYQLRHTPRCISGFSRFPQGFRLRARLKRRVFYYSKVFSDCQVCSEKSIENFPALSWQGFFRGGLIRDDCPPPLSEIAQDRPLAFIRLFAIVKVKKQTHQGGSLQKDVSGFLLLFFCGDRWSRISHFLYREQAPVLLYQSALV